MATRYDTTKLTNNQMSDISLIKHAAETLAAFIDMTPMDRRLKAMALTDLEVCVMKAVKGISNK